ncbi:putative signal peptide-containing protein [Cryptosporidium canis]|uniref:Signal peptide-containing protein n=1 Tax=Cryptosporidium canis TaxID=195482 RepID=A0ABQ8P7G9_9CRYT|nr:putative signal peptide-containing protein [Cryptosporidium canis]KAJ1615090.1 putative signal peptide-containing protein [Cryptosporidium canis]
MCSLGSSGLYSVPPSDKCRKYARQLKFLLIIEFMTLIILFVLVPTGGTVWVLLQVFSIILAYISVKDTNAYRPPILQMYIFISALGTLFCTIYFAVSLSIAGSAISIAACTLFAVNALVLAACTRISWQLFKELMLCSPLITGTTGAYIFGTTTSNSNNGLSVNSNANNGPIEMTSDRVGGSNMFTGSNLGSSGGFVPFGGEGYKLSGCKSSASNERPAASGSNSKTLREESIGNNRAEIKSLV